MKRLLFFLVLPAFFMLTPELKAQKSLQFDDIFSDKFSTENVKGIEWSESGKYYTRLLTGSKGNEIRRYNVSDGSYRVLLAGKNHKVGPNDKPLVIADYEFSPNRNYLLIETDVESIWRRSTKANYYVYDLQQEKLRKLTDREDKIQYAHFAPEGLKVGYVYKNNLYINNLETRQTRQITQDGQENKIINGEADWVYEEEFSFARAWFWSPDGQRIAFYRFDVRNVPEYSIPIYEGPEKKYPRMMTYRYPKPGETNASVRIGVYDWSADSVSWMDVESDGDRYFVRVDWTQHSDTLSIRRMNRLQNQQDLLFADPRTGRTWVARTKKSKTWIDENDDLTFLPDQNGYLFVSEESGYNHIYHSSMSGDRTRQVTHGSWEVTRIAGYDPDQDRVYYMSTEPSPLERQLYSINLDGSQKKRLTTRRGWHQIHLSPAGRYYIDRYSNSVQPPMTTLHRTGKERIRTLVENKKVAKLRKEYQFPQREYMQVHIPEAGTLNAYMMKPADFDSSKKYPVLMYVYGGPGSQTVTRSYQSGQSTRWQSYLVQQGYIIFSMDNRGTGARGRVFEKQVYKQLGKYESHDQIAAARYLSSLPYIDESRIGIWGWSYGGYVTSLVLGKGGDLIDAGISVAPVTHWKFYDTIYTERYMQTPEKNPEGYRESSALKHADGITGDYLLVHGTADDNVHFQNAVELVEEMVRHDVDYETLYYPNKDHSIAGGNTRQHFFRNLTDFIMDNL